jgi:hypothetical protein
MLVYATILAQTMVFWKKKRFWALMAAVALGVFWWGFLQNQKTLPVINDPRENIALYDGFSTSAQLSEEGFKNLVEKLPKPLIIVDLREETHGFANGVAISWYSLRNWANRGVKQEEITQQEAALFQALKQSGWGIVWGKKWLPLPYKAHHCQTEKELVESLGASYRRIAITDHLCPSETATSALTTLFEEVESQDPKPWIHFHCAAGRGRSKTAACMLHLFRQEGVRAQAMIKSEDWGGDINEEKILFLKEYADSL